MNDPNNVPSPRNNSRCVLKAMKKEVLESLVTTACFYRVPLCFFFLFVCLFFSNLLQTFRATSADSKYGFSLQFIELNT